MHEIRIAEDLCLIVLDTAKKENLTKVTKVNVSIGQLVQIVPDIFKFAFSVAVRNSLAQDAETNIEIIPVQLKCKKCGSDFHLTNNLFECEVCSSTDLEIVHGKELFIKSIEGE
jgi:hydrogenase nickel incorporation protein HypA/HybF